MKGRNKMDDININKISLHLILIYDVVQSFILVKFWFFQSLLTCLISLSTVSGEMVVFVYDVAI